jgi:hypothetical protein
MKKLLLFTLLVAGSFTANAQYDCTDATVITDNGTITAPDVAGTFVSGVCYTHAFDNTGSGDMYGLWYSFTPSSNGVVDITSDLPQNVAPFSDDTKVSIFTGTCDALVCYDANDDTSGTNYLSTISFPVAAGVTYYIQWDNYWNAAGFDFDFTFTPQTCVPVFYVNNPTNLTVSSVTLNWDSSVSLPEGYEVEYGLTGFTQGTGTVVATATNSLDLSSLTTSGVYDYYIRANCGSGNYSDWTSANILTLPVVCPYSSGLDDANQIAGWSTTGFTLSATSANSQSAPNYLFANSSTTSALNARLNSRALLLQANEVVTVTFYARLGSATGTTPHTLKVFANTSTSLTGATQLGATINVNSATYTLQTRTFTAPATGIYYFIFNDVTPVVATTAAVTSLRIDTFGFTSVLGTNEYLASNITTYPNPAKNVINISNGLNAVIESIELTDLNGRVVKTQNINATEGQVSISDLSAGVYMMKVSTDQGVATKKVVKQ